MYIHGIYLYVDIYIYISWLYIIHVYSIYYVYCIIYMYICIWWSRPKYLTRSSDSFMSHPRSFLTLGSPNWADGARTHLHSHIPLGKKQGPSKFYTIPGCWFRRSFSFSPSWDDPTDEFGISPALATTSPDTFLVIFQTSFLVCPVNQQPQKARKVKTLRW